MHGERGKVAHFSGVERCGSIWACPVCAAVIRAVRAAEIQEAVRRWESVGGTLALVTLTMRHKRTDALAPLLDAALDGWRRLIRGTPWRKFAARLGLQGYVRTVEITDGAENGWHPHVHALFFVEEPLSEETVAEARAWLFERWCGILERLGIALPNEAHGVDVRAADGTGKVLARYLGKVQDVSKRVEVGKEIARGDVKAGRGRVRMNPFEHLDSDDPESGARWMEYYEATRGRRAITWSRDLRTFLGMDAEQTDEEVMEDTESQPLLFLLDGAEYDELRRTPERLALVLELVELGDEEHAEATARDDAGTSASTWVDKSAPACMRQSGLTNDRASIKVDHRSSGGRSTRRKART